jgi:hypothetical protein
MSVTFNVPSVSLAHKAHTPDLSVDQCVLSGNGQGDITGAKTAIGLFSATLGVLDGRNETAIVKITRLSSRCQAAGRV